MSVVLFSLSLFASAFFFHWLLWQFCIPKRQILGLLCLFEGYLAFALLLAWVFPQAAIWPGGPWPWLHVILAYEAFSLGYIVTYSALEQDSASMTIVLFVAEAGAQGRTRDELYALIDQDFIIGYRFKSMLHGNLINKTGDVYRLTSKGAFWAKLFRWYRSLFRLRLGG